tara:strand:- start:24 stop:1088 length:1065 start_codon:yes stop_codon:yes gene_type:complete
MFVEKQRISGSHSFNKGGNWNKWLPLILIVFLSTGCELNKSERSVVIYTSLDQIFSEPILRNFEKKTGIRVLPVFDIEANKTVGLANRLIAEKSRPQADVFWNSEFGQTIRLKEEGVFAPYVSSNAEDIPSQYRDPQDYWIGFGARARIILVNTRKLSPDQYPTSVFDLLNPKYPSDKVAMAYPIFGTTLTQAAAMYAALGEDSARNFYKGIKGRGIRIVDGNSVVRDLVASGRLHAGLTDTDDACGAIKKGAPVKVIFPDQDGIGTLIIPNTVAMIAGATHPREAEELIDYLLSEEVEQKLIKAGAIQMSLYREGITSGCIPEENVKNMQVSYSDILHNIEIAGKELRDIFIR